MFFFSVGVEVFIRYQKIQMFQHYTVKEILCKGPALGRYKITEVPSAAVSPFNRSVTHEPGVVQAIKINVHFQRTSEGDFCISRREMEAALRSSAHLLFRAVLSLSCPAGREIPGFAGAAGRF